MMGRSKNVGYFRRYNFLVDAVSQKSPPFFKGMRRD